MLISLSSFMVTNEQTTGGLQTSDHHKRILARKSLQFNLENTNYRHHFGSKLEKTMPKYVAKPAEKAKKKKKKRIVRRNCKRV